MGTKVFICYRQDKDASHAGRVKDWLQQEFGPDLIFTDVDGIPLGIDFAKVLNAGLAFRNALDVRHASFHSACGRFLSHVLFP